MILFPNMDMTVFIQGDNFCNVAGDPWQIAYALLIEEIKVNDKTSVIKPVFKDLQIYDNGDMAVFLYEEIFDHYNIKYTTIKQVHPAKIFKEAKWTD